jgi:hypothetical protein
VERSFEQSYLRSFRVRVTPSRILPIVSRIASISSQLPGWDGLDDGLADDDIDSS